MFAGTVHLSREGFKLAQETKNNGTFTHPKLPNLQDPKAVDEAIRLVATRDQTP